jgi:hypothetical protein
MKLFTWKDGEIRQGLALASDERLGKVVALGEAGRGRRFEKVGLDRFEPAEIVDGCVLEAHLKKITLAAKPEKGLKEKTFYVLQKPHKNEEGAVLVRICTDTGYLRGANGRYSTVEGQPVTLISGHGAFGEAGRVGSWADSLVTMKKGDVVRVRPSRGEHSYALWLDGGKPVTATWQEYENVVAVKKSAAADPEIIFGQMQAFTFADGQIKKGVIVDSGATGPVVALGEAGRGRSLVEVPIVESTLTTEGAVTSAAVADLGEGIIGLTQSEKSETGAVLVRVSTAGPYTRGTRGEVKIHKGDPTILVSGYGAHGGAGRIGGWQDSLVVLKEGDVLYVRQEGGYKSAGPWALFIQDGKPKVEAWAQFLLQDGESDPEFYLDKATSTINHVPSEWIGQVVTVCTLEEWQRGCGPKKKSLDEVATGEFIRFEAESVVLNLGWDGKDYHEARVYGEWVCLEKDKQVRRLEGKEAERRKNLRAEAEQLKEKAIMAMNQIWFELADDGLRRQIEVLTHGKEFNIMPTEGWENSLTSWVSDAKAVLVELAEVESELEALEERQSSGEVLNDFGGHFRISGRTGNAQYWVVAPDGTERKPDEVSYRKRYTSEGEKCWHLVGPEELAISWFKANSAANHEFVADKIPVDGCCTPEQLATVERIEREIESEWEGVTGVSGKVSPSVGEGWGLK